GQRNKNAERRMDALVVMSRIAAGATPAELGFELSDLPAALRPRDGDWIGEPAPVHPGRDAANEAGPPGVDDQPPAGGDPPISADRPASGGDPPPAGGDPPTEEGGSGPEGDPPSVGGPDPGGGSGPRPRYRPRGPASPVIN